MLRNLSALLLFLAAGPVIAADSTRYVSDELVIVMRGGADSGSAVVASLNSGTRVQVVSGENANGYAQVRLEDGRSGWVQSRYLSPGVPGRQRAERAEKQLAEAESELKTLRDEHAKLSKELTRISAGQPPPPPEAIAHELETLRLQVSELQQQNESLSAVGGEARERQRTLALGGALVLAGFVLAWLIRWLWPRRRWSEL